MNLIIDEGNTRIKLAVFKNFQLVELEYTTLEKALENMFELKNKYSITSIIVSSVTDKVVVLIKHLEVKNTYVLSHKLDFPFTNLYKTPETLGVDRLALVSSAYYQYTNENSLMIDVGTCITYDFLDKQGNYFGGAITPGMQMRLDAMHQLTEKLPQFKIKETSYHHIGSSTELSMLSGAVNGTIFEINGFIKKYKDKDPQFNVILSGGDANFLFKNLKNSIFVNPNFLLEGLNHILAYQLEK